MRLLSLSGLTLVTVLMLSACSPEPNPPATVTENASESNSASNQAPARQFKEGQHYNLLAKPVIEPQLQRYLTEYFWLGCPHCQNFEPLLKGYLTNNPNVTLVRKHPALGDRWAIDASIFYGLQQHGHGHLVTLLLDMYRQTRLEKNALPDINAINAFLQQHQIDPDTFAEQLKSDSIITAMEQANREMLDNRLSGVPSLVVNGKYLVNGEQPDDVKTAEDYYQLLDYLLNKN
ncbi:thiol:disulfide interchange protein DsbA/DsbL [Alishewanella tabrizica]|uniref:Thiol:disulfide interchange protein DsbA n=1 Tax=Alishewanella tabrizica TaxID=671278 RepID=A0ABQ2WGD9_9ALTE|nr:thiol:disulfide interchange protein DsbA/DsbL [Alishewanella tabrizica]GGW55104.1 thiol:disulfide interchange protein [Alishewanella tabrizica]